MIDCEEICMCVRVHVDVHVWLMLFRPLTAASYLPGTYQDIQIEIVQVFL